MNLFEDFLSPPESKREPTVAARVTQENPKSQNPDDPYVDLDAEDIPPFVATDPLSAVFGPGERYEIHEVSYSPSKGTVNGYGYRFKRDGTVALKPANDAIPLVMDELPSAVYDRLQR